jgi:plasmid stability protein
VPDTLVAAEVPVTGRVLVEYQATKEGDMAEHTLTLTLPEPVLKTLRARAEHSNRTVEAEAAEWLAQAPAVPEEGPRDLDALLAPFRAKTDEELRALLCSSLTAQEQQRVADLNARAAATGLTEQEREEQGRLVALFDEKLLLRAQALGVLRERGYSLAELIGAP